MSTQFWVGIAIGAVLSLIASIVANLLNQRIQNTFDTFQLSRSTKRRAKALRQYHQMKGLSEGRRDKYLHVIFLSETIHTGFLLAIACICMCGLFISLAILPADTFPKIVDLGFERNLMPKWAFGIGALLMLFFALISLSLAQIAALRFRRDTTILYNFTKYAARMKSRWDFTDEEIESIRPDST